MEEFIAKKNLCPYVTGEEVLCEKTVACKGCEYCPDTDDDIWETIEAGTEMISITESALDEMRNKSYWQGYGNGYDECKAEFMETFGEPEDMSEEMLKVWRAGYRECKLNNADLEALTISPIFLEYVYKIRNMVMDLHNQTGDENFTMHLYDISNELSKMTECVVMDKVYAYWEYK